MSSMQLVLVILQGLIFAAWALVMFRCLFHVRRRAEQKTGQVFSGPVTFLGAIREWLSDPDERKWRVLLLILTVALILKTGLSAILPRLT